MLLKQSILKSLEEVADKEIARAISQYMKNVTEYRGIKQPLINQIFKKYWNEKLKDLHKDELFTLGETLIKEQYGEDKGVALLIMKKIIFDKQHIIHTEQWFKEGHIRGWAVTDTFSSNVLKPWVKNNNENAAYMLQWARSENIWMKRASCVGFVNLAKKADQDIMDILYQICRVTVKDQERFVQLGCGWLLREMWLRDNEGVVAFIGEHLQEMSSEGLRYACEKMGMKMKKELMRRRRQQ